MKFFATRIALLRFLLRAPKPARIPPKNHPSSRPRPRSDGLPLSCLAAPRIRRILQPGSRLAHELFVMDAVSIATSWKVDGRVHARESLWRLDERDFARGR